MTEQAILKSRSLKRRFCKDNNIPITVYENPYFMQRLKLFDPFYDTLHKWRNFTEMLFDFINEKSYFDFCDGIINQAVADITGKTSFQCFNFASIIKMGRMGQVISGNEKKRYNLVRIGRRNVYIPENNGKWFISIDMRKANFNALRLFDKDIVDNCSDWETFIGQYTTYPAIINSKYIRQVILGKCNPKRIANYEQLLMECLAFEIVTAIPEIEIYSVAGDEIILYDEGEYKRLERVAAVVQKSTLADCVKIEQFEVHDLSSDLETIYSKVEPGLGYARVSPAYTAQIKCVSADVLPQVIRAEMREEIQPEDLIFIHDGKLAQFLEPVIRH